MKKLLLIIGAEVLLVSLLVFGIAYAVSQFTTNVPAGVTVVLAPTPTPTPTPVPAPALSVSPSSLNFGQIIQGQTGSVGLTLTNTGNVPLDSFSVGLNGTPIGVGITAWNLPGTLNPGQAQTVSLDLSVDASVGANYYPFNVVVTAYY